MYQLPRLLMLKFYYDFLGKYLNSQDFELCYMDTDSFYLALTGGSLDEIIKPWLGQAYKIDKENCLLTNKFS